MQKYWNDVINQYVKDNLKINKKQNKPLCLWDQ